MYPDWRFRPGSNALAKLKTKDGGTTMRRRSARVKAPPDEAGDDDSDHKGKGQEKGKGKNRSAPRTPSLEEMRCAKIADFVADGIQGEELEVAVKEWEGDRKMGKQRSQKPRASRARGASSASTHPPYTKLTVASSPASDNQYPNNPSPDSSSNPPQHLIIDAAKPAPDDSSSADDISPYMTEPRSGSWDNYNGPLIMQMSPTGTHSHPHERRDSISFPMPSGTNMATNFDAPQQHLTWQEAENQRRMEEIQEPNLWWGDSRSAEVGPWYSKVDGPTEHNGGRCTSTATEMGYENSGVNPFDSGYGEVCTFSSCSIILLITFYSSIHLMIHLMMEVKTSNGPTCLIIPIDMDLSPCLKIPTEIVAIPIPLTLFHLQLSIHHPLSPIAITIPNSRPRHSQL